MAIGLRLFLVVCLFLAACAGEDDAAESSKGVDWNAIDLTVDPCRDFYLYACGNWQRTHPLPADGTTLGRTDDAFYALVPKLRGIIESDFKGMRAADDPYAAQIGDFYGSCLHATQDTQSRTELANLLKPVTGIKSLDELARQLAEQAKSGSTALFRSPATRDLADPTRMILGIDQSGIELRNRADYLDAARADLRTAYREHIAVISRFFNGVVIDPDQVIAVETELAKAYRTPEERRDPRLWYHPMSRAELAALAPTFPWQVYFDALGVGSVTQVMVADPDYVRALDELLKHTEIGALRSYLAWQFLQDKVDFLDSSIAATDFAFWSKHYTGQPEQADRDWVCYNQTLSWLGQAVSRPYIARYFDQAARADVTDMLEQIRGAMAQHLENATWLDDDTRSEAMAKLDALAGLIGYPDEYRNYDALTLVPDSYLTNNLRISQLLKAQSIASLDRVAKRDDWAINPITVNAIYAPTQNALLMPAAVLALPFFGHDNYPASNYGAIGTFIGHELSHGFDDQGSHFDASGALRNWWTAQTEENFNTRTQCLVDQFSSYAVASGDHVNGRLTLGENVADLGGVLLAQDAFEHSAPGRGKVHGYDPKQLFYLSFAQLWCENVRPEYVRQSLMTDPHSPQDLRVNGTLVNVPQFADAFHCSGPAPSIARRSEEMCQVW